MKEHLKNKVFEQWLIVRKELLCVCADLFSRNFIWNTNRNF